LELYETIRQQQSVLINKNPTSIVINRITRTRSDDGGETETPSTLAVQTVRIYAPKTKQINVRITNTTDSGFHIKRSIKMICQYNADVKAESEVYLDTFTAYGRTYKITDVIDHITQSQICFKESQIEEVA